MTPLTTFQCPLSPVGTFQPSRSLPLNSGTNPSEGPSAHDASPTAKRVNVAAPIPTRHMVRPPSVPRAARRPGDGRFTRPCDGCKGPLPVSRARIAHSPGGQGDQGDQGDRFCAFVQTVALVTVSRSL